MPTSAESQHPVNSCIHPQNGCTRQMPTSAESQHPVISCIHPAAATAHQRSPREEQAGKQQR
eukprot:365384-Chlamydomonas_euryale.AAC.5